jgi:ribonuclease T2
MRRLGNIAVLLLGLLAVDAAAQPQCRLPDSIPVEACGRDGVARGRAGDFDFYILSMSWSPAYCATAAGRRSPLQCRDNRFGWVPHGLWPQYAAARGIAPSWPQYCGPAAPLPAEILRRHLCVMPDPRLMQCEWAKHGSCAGFASADAYFDALTAATTRLALPDPPGDGRGSAAAMRAALLAANPALRPEMLQVVRREGRIREIRVCLDTALRDFVACAKGGLR